MKIFKLENLNCGKIQLNDMKNNIISENTLTKVHGSNIILNDWNENMRTFKLIQNTPNIPRIIKSIFNSHNVNIIVEQKLTENNNLINIKNNIKPQILMSRFINIQSEVNIKKESDISNTLIDIQISVNAYVLPPIKQILEKYVFEMAKRDTLIYKEVIQEIINQNIY